MQYTLPKLPYACDALEPYIDAKTMEIHHDKHHGAYVTNLNKALEGKDLGSPTVEELLAAINTLPEEIRTAVRNHGGGHANHTLFWNLLKKGATKEPKGSLAEAIAKCCGDFAGCRAELTKAAMGRFGSGWAWLSVDADKNLLVESTANQDSPIMHGHTPILGIDVWEHAYYLKYQNRRNEYVEAFFNVVDWDAVHHNFEEALEHAGQYAHAAGRS